MSETTHIERIKRVIWEYILEYSSTCMGEHHRVLSLSDKRGELGKQIDAQLAALTTFAEETEKWQSIETAPKDGTTILVFGIPHGSIMHSNPGKFPVFGCGAVGTKQVGEAYYSAGLWQRKDGTFKDVTHWRPLPPAPSTGEKPE